MRHGSVCATGATGATSATSATSASATSAAKPQDQAHGLRRLFARGRQRFVPLVHNPHVGFAGVGMERMCAAFAEQGLRTLVVDAADTASTPHELAHVDLSACVERLSSSVWFLAARGLPMRWLDSRGTTAGFLESLAAAMPEADVVLVHAGASDLNRMFAGRAPRPVLLADEHAESLTHAYACMKLMTQRLRVMAFDLVLASDAPWPRLAQVAERLADCADRFLGAALGEWAQASACAHEDEPLPLDPKLRRLVAAQLTGPDACNLPGHLLTRTALPASTRHAN